MKSLKALIIEDSEDDTFLLVRNLKQNDFNVDYIRIETEQQMIEALDDESWDIIIADHTLPTFSSTEALSLIQKNNLDIPLIILSGNINPKIAIESMRNGAKDFIMKDDTSRLIPAIERELFEKNMRHEKKKADEQLIYLAYHDCLTGLVNRAEFEKRLETALKSAKEKGFEHSLLYLDLDNFKIVNDSCGHLAGDELLKQLSSTMLINLRERDTLARVGGDEFCILLENCPLSKASQIAQNISQNIQEFNFLWDNKVYKIGVSIGLLNIDKQYEDVKELINSVDAACYTAKEQGNSSVQIYDKNIHEILKQKENINWINHIDNALINNNFILYKQIIEPLQENDMKNHIEILVRLEHEGNIILPYTFISAAERYSKMLSIDKWVIENIFQKIQASSNLANSFISINLSGQSLGDKRLCDFIIDSYKKYEINPHLICFEITETATISNFKIAHEFFLRMKELGFSLSLDDFGTGLSSFSYLKNMPIDFVKIDGNFIKNLQNDTIDQSIVRSINEISHQLGAKTIAECVENDTTKKILQDMHIDFAQGYVIHKPVPL